MTKRGGDWGEGSGERRKRGLDSVALVHHGTRMKKKPHGACVLWPGSKDKDGYGFVKIRGKQLRAHRVSLERKIGRPLGRDWALHLCDNPSCVNADHLAVGSVAENNRQSRAKRVTLAMSVLGVEST